MADFTIEPPDTPKKQRFTILPPTDNVSRETSGVANPWMQAFASAGLWIPPAQREKGSFAQSFEKGVKDIPAEIGRTAKGYVSEMGKELAEVRKPENRLPLGPAQVGLTEVKMLLSAAGLLQSPVEGAVRSGIGRPIEQASGIPRDVTTGAAMLAMPMLKGAKAPEELEDGIKAVQKLFAPTSISEESRGTERIIRRATGEGDIEAERAAHELVKHNRIVGNLPVLQQRAIIYYIENKSKGVPAPKDPRQKAAADAIAKVYDRYRSRIEYILGKEGEGGPSFIKNYYVHLWNEKPDKVEDILRAYYSRQGTDSNLKKRIIPTIEDGLKAGLTLRVENPIEATMFYVRNMSRFLATHNIQHEMRDLRYAKWFIFNKAPKGWRELEGIMTRKTVTPKEGKAFPIQLYAPEAAARVYNNFISKGFETGDAGPLFVAARHLANGVTQLILGLSGFHFGTMGQEGLVSETARAYKALSVGDVKTSLSAGAKVIAAPVRSSLRGRRMAQELLGTSAYAPNSISKKVNDAFVRSGGRLRMDPFYRARPSGSFFNAMERGTFRREALDALKRLNPFHPVKAVKGGVDLTLNIIQTVMAPLFEKYIPSMKRGAFASSMESWLRQNPRATQKMIDEYAIKLNDSIDNRFGELVSDNIFWRKSMKQLLQIALLSSTWDIGTVREIMGGLIDAVPSAVGILKGKGITDRTAYVAALASVVALENGIITYIKTGTMPHGMDFLAYRTGGTDVTMKRPERALIPGYQKDVYAFGYDFPHHILDESYAKLNPIVTAPIELSRNFLKSTPDADYRGLPITRPEGVKPVKGEPDIFDDVVNRLIPLSFRQFEKAKKGSNISIPERLLGIRPAPMYLTAHDVYEKMQAQRNKRLWKHRIKSDRRIKSREQQ